jgi:hypothetical protein
MMEGVMVSKVSELTVDELRLLIREELESLVRETVREVLSELTDDPDAGLTFKPEIAARLQAYLDERPAGLPLDDVLDQLGLDV